MKLGFELKEFAAKEKLEIVSGAAPPRFDLFAGGFPRHLRRRKPFELSSEYCIEFIIKHTCFKYKINEKEVLIIKLLLIATLNF